MMNRRNFLKAGAGLSAAALAAVVGLGGVVPTLAYHSGVGAGWAMPFGRSGKFAGAPNLDIIAKTLGITVAELQSALASGKSVADVAAEKNVALSSIVDAIVEEHKRQLDTAVAAGRLTQAQADTLLANLRTVLPAQLQVKPVVGLQPGPKGLKGFGRGRKGGFGAARQVPLGVVADAMGITVNELWTELWSGKSIADVAKEKNVSLDKISDAVVSAVKSDLDAAVTNGRLTQAQADALLGTLKANLPLLLQLKYPARPTGVSPTSGGWMFMGGPRL